MASLESPKVLFRLKNTRLNRVLSRPAGEMYVTDREEAESMLRACHEYLDAVGLGRIKNEFIIEEVNGEQLQEM